MIKRWLLVISVIFVVISIINMNGYRFTALNAAKNNPFLSEDAVLVDEYEVGSSVIFLFKNDEEYRTVLSEKSGVIFKSRLSTFSPYSSDEFVQTVGGMSFTTEKNTGTFLSVQSNDDDIAYIEAGNDVNRKRKKINKGERVSFIFPYSKQINFLDAVAYDKDGNELYYFGYSKDYNVTNHMDLSWHKIKERNNIDGDK